MTKEGKSKKKKVKDNTPAIEVRIICQNCRHYSKSKCGVTHLFTARKETCSEWGAKR